MKKYFIGLGFLFAAIFTFQSLTVEATMTPINSPTESSSHTIKVYVTQGWNLVAATVPSSITSSSEVKADDITAVWFYSPVQKKYLELYPNLDSAGFASEDDDEVFTSGAWLYSNKTGMLEYKSMEDYTSFDKRNLYAGWNIFTRTPDMRRVKLVDMTGTCTVEKAAGYSNGNWAIYTPGTSQWRDLELINSQQDEGSALLLKVTKNCNLGKSVSGTSTVPPTLPL